jgi:hypothetical protein
LTAQIFDPTFIAIAFIGTLVLVSLKENLARVFSLLGGVASLYCLAAGIFLLSGGYVDPLASADPEIIGRAAVRRGGGVVLLLFRVWPYFLIGWGALGAIALFAPKEK